MAPAQLLERARQAGIDRIAVTDHGSVEGALEAQALDPARVIVGEEIHPRGGPDLIGLFLREHVPGGLTVEETARRIRDQGGIVYAPHPFAYARRTAERSRVALAAADVVEVFNSRAFAPHWNLRAQEAARRLGKPAGAGSDAHFPWEIGRGFVEMPAFETPAEFLAALREGKIVRRAVGSPFLHVASLVLARIRRLG